MQNKEIHTLGRIDPNSGYLVESCCIFFIVVLRWFTSTLSNQEPLKTNSASITYPVTRKGDLVGWFIIIIKTYNYELLK